VKKRAKGTSKKTQVPTLKKLAANIIDKKQRKLWKAGLICSKFSPADPFAKICYLIFQNSIRKFTIYYYNLHMISPMCHPIKIMMVTDGGP